MNFWNKLKYVLMVLFALIIIAGVVMATDHTTASQQPVPQTSGSKFNL